LSAEARRAALTRCLLLAVACVAALCASPAVHAWSKAGHRVTGVIAYRVLAASDPAIVTRVIALVKAHPAARELAQRLDEEGSDRGARAERLFAELAQWPDEARKGPYAAWHRPAWHTVDLPYVRPGGGYAGTPPGPVEENLLWAWHRNAAIVGDEQADPTERAVALCWLFHLAGDVHQPLHVITLFDRTFSNGDRHGGRYRVRVDGQPRTQSLHAFWDGVVLRSVATSNVRSTASALMGGFPQSMLHELPARPYAGPEDFDRWAREESYPLAVEHAYGRLPAAESASAVTVLDEGYVAAARQLAARRMALSGYRLAAVLRVVLRRTGARAKRRR
jgi:hypothetical protein